MMRQKKYCLFAEIAFPVPLRQAFTYSIPADWQASAQVGCRVYAPFGKRNALGYIVSLRDEPPADVATIKELSSVIDDTPLFSDELLQFLNWVSDYYLCSQGEVYAAAYPFPVDIQSKTVSVVRLSDAVQHDLSLIDSVSHPVQRKILAYLQFESEDKTVAELARVLDITSSPIKTLQKKGFIETHSVERQRVPQYSTAEREMTFELSAEQKNSIEQIERFLEQKERKPILLKGVTGSGKTEVYLQAIDRVLRRGQNALVLIPEIALTPQTMNRFRNRFGDLVGILHSGLGAGERFDEWRMAQSGKRRILVGTRSAVFAPVQRIGIVIVDEEHESSYKQSDPNPRYHGRDVAVVRAHLSGALCILGSATPSVESGYNAKMKKYHTIRLNKRIASHGMPQISLLDMRGRTEEEEIFARELMQALWQRFESKQQSILFLNRRGFSTSLTCKKCGQILSCKHCSVALVYHRSRTMLVCHHCDYRAPLPSTCPHCADPLIRQQGFGTERVVHELEEKIPGVRIVRLDRDSTAKKGEHNRLLTQFRQGEADILVGTQMIAKGLDFPNVTLVGVINADYTLSLPDFRASERTFILLTQVAGRAGRGTEAGEVYIQSFCPDHYSIQLALNQNYDVFYEKEIRYRRLIGFPPFSRVVLWRIEAMKEDYARGKAWELYEILKEGGGGNKALMILPPVEAPLYRLRDYYRWQVALKSQDYKAYRPVVNCAKLTALMSTRRQGLRIVQDVDPWDML
jgi:primosomal protein N' (replication factor Y) (superfamily II helicase)